MRELRAWQNEALAAWSVEKRGVASVITGAGKTMLAVACIDQVWSSDPSTRVLVVVPTTALLDQWLIEFHTELGVRRSEIGLYGGGFFDRASQRLNIAVVNTARNITPTLTRRGHWMIIADECHRYAAPANRRAISASWAASLGLSATPAREYDDWFEEFVAPPLGQIFFEYGYQRALQEGILTPFHLHNYRINLTAHELAEVDRLNRRIAMILSRSNEADGLLKTALRQRAQLYQGAKARIPAAREIMRSRMGIKTLVFHERIQQADALTDVLRKDGHRVALYHSGLNVAARQLNLLMFRTGQIDVLVTCRALDEGLDIPGAEFGLICSSTASQRQRIQRMGRVLRSARGKNNSEVATIYAGENERLRLQAEAERLVGVASVRWLAVRES